MKFARNAAMIGMVLMGALAWAVGLAAPSNPGAGPGSLYQDVNKCKDCHDQDSTGNQWRKWQEEKHSKAYQTLANDKAKKLALSKGIKTSPQAADQCLKCHVTAFGVPKERLDDGFSIKPGVQCDTCHGPGSGHINARAAAAYEAEFGDDPFGPPGKGKSPPYIALPKGEVQFPDQKACEKCHNTDSPSFKSFNYDEEKKKNQHLDPRKKK